MSDVVALLVILDIILLAGLLITLRNVAVLAARLPLWGVRASGGLELGISAPAFSLPRRDGSPVALSVFNNMSVLVVFVTARCASCRPTLRRLAQLLRECPDDNSRVLVVASGEEAVGAYAPIADQVPIVFDSAETVAQQYKVTAYPMAYVLDGKDDFKVVICGILGTSREVDNVLEAAAVV